MVIYQFPTDSPHPFQGRISEEKTDEDFKQDPHQKEEGFIEVEEVLSQEMQSDQFKALMGSTYPFTWRLVTFLASFCLLAGSAFFFFCFVLAKTCCFATYGKVLFLNKRASAYWSKAKKMFVFFIALLIASFSPALGIGMLVVYSAMTGSSLSNVFLSGFGGISQPFTKP